MTVPLSTTENQTRILQLDESEAQQLFGAHDHNLALIETKLNVRLAARGAAIEISGAESDRRLVEDVLRALRARIAGGQGVSQADVETAIRIATQPLPEVADVPHVMKSFAKIATRRSSVEARSAAQDRYIKAMRAHQMVFGVGPAGTGKTFLAVAYAAAMLESGEVDRIILTRPAVEAGERLGFLPGDMREKVDPYLRPLFDALHDMISPEKVERFLAAGTIEIAPLAFMRGRTLRGAAIILDEAQNTSVMQMKMFLTRLGEGSKMFITGDPSQIDLPSGERSGLRHALGILKGVDGISEIRFTSADVVRHELVTRIVSAYDAAEKQQIKRRNESGHGAD